MSSQETEVLAWLKENAKPIQDYELESIYDDLLDDIYGEVRIAGYCYPTSRTLKEIDPTAYRCGFVDWLASDENYVEIGGEYWSTEDYNEAVDALDEEESDEDD